MGWFVNGNLCANKPKELTEGQTREIINFVYDENLEKFYNYCKSKRLCNKDSREWLDIFHSDGTYELVGFPTPGPIMIGLPFVILGVVVFFASVGVNTVVKDMF